MTSAAAAGSSPIDIIVIGFEGNEFSGDLMPEMVRLSESGTVRVVDIVFVSKDAGGVVTSARGADLARGGPGNLPEIEVLQPGALGLDDVSEVGQDLHEQSSALVVAFENTWAGTFVSAIRESRGEVLRFTRVPADLAETTLEQSPGGLSAER